MVLSSIDFCSHFALSGCQDIKVDPVNNLKCIYPNGKIGINLCFKRNALIADYIDSKDRSFVREVHSDRIV